MVRRRCLHGRVAMRLVLRRVPQPMPAAVTVAATRTTKAAALVVVWVLVY